MIIDKIDIYNFGIYVGKQSLVLSPPTPNKPIILIGGDNGAGKTTLLDALQICLYGKLALKDDKNHLSYNKYLESLINRKVNPSEGASIQVTFRVIEDGFERRYLICRQWLSSNGQTKEKLEVYVDDKLDQVLSDTWYEQVERFIPARLRHMYMFDGERVEAFADVDNTSSILSAAVKTLLGIDLVDQLRTDLKVISQRKSKQIQSQEKIKTIDELELKLKETNAHRYCLISKITQVERNLSAAKKHYRKIDDMFAEKGGLLFKQHHELEIQRSKIRTGIENVESELKTKASGSLPLDLLVDYLNDIRHQALLEDECTQDDIARDRIKKRDKRLINWFRKEGVDEDSLHALKEFIKREKQSETIRKTNIYLNLDRRSIIQLENLVFNTLKDEKGICSKLTVEHQNFLSELDRIDRKLASTPDDGSIKNIIVERDKATKKIYDIDNQMKNLNEQLNAKNAERHRLVAQLDGLLRKQKITEFENSEIYRFLKFCDSIDDLMSSFHTQILEKNLRHLEELILESYRQLLHKDSILGSIKINQDQFKMTIYNVKGEEIPSNQLSAGERQLLAISILWGLGKASGRPLPILIDTPLSKLDSKHRTHLIKRYFPKASHQVILLSTDEEIDKKYYEKLKTYIGHAYKIEYDDNTESSNIVKGYYW